MHQRAIVIVLRLPNETASWSPPALGVGRAPRIVRSTAPWYTASPTLGRARHRLAAGDAPAPGSLHLLLLPHRLRGRGALRQAEDHDRVAQGIADLEVAAAGYPDELLAPELEGHRRRVAARPGVELPEELAGLRVVGVEVAVAFTGEGEAAGGRERAAHHRLGHLVLPG